MRRNFFAVSSKPIYYKFLICTANKKKWTVYVNCIWTVYQFDQTIKQGIWTYWFWFSSLVRHQTDYLHAISFRYTIAGNTILRCKVTNILLNIYRVWSTIYETCLLKNIDKNYFLAVSSGIIHSVNRSTNTWKLDQMKGIWFNSYRLHVIKVSVT